MPIHFNLLADAADDGSERVVVHEIAVHIPQLMEHLGLGQDQTAVLDEEVQGAVFFRGEIYGGAV